MQLFPSYDLDDVLSFELMKELSENPCHEWIKSLEYSICCTEDDAKNSI